MKKAMVIWQVILIALAVFAAIIMIIIFGQKMGFIDNVSGECEQNNGQCVAVEDCSTCSTYASCKLEYSFNCKDTKDQDGNTQNLICCPNEGVI